MKTAKDIFDEFEEVYVKDPSARAITRFGACVYEASDGRRCAVGRCCTDPANLSEGDVNAISVRRDGRFTIDPFLRPEYRGHSLDFWRDLQDLHDEPLYWTPTGLSEFGAKTFAELKEIYAKNDA